MLNEIKASGVETN